MRHHSSLPLRDVLIALLFPLIAASPALAQRVRQLTHFDRFEIADYVLDDAGAQAFFVADNDPLGTNPRVIKQIFRDTLPGGSVEQLTTLDRDVEELSASDDGQTLLFRSSADPLGTNADHSIELFVAHGDGSSIVQLTDDQGSGMPVVSARVSGDGNRAVFVTATAADPDWQLYVVGADGNGLTKLTTGTGGWIEQARISDDGERIVFCGTRDLTGQNPDGSVEVFRILANASGLTQVTDDAAVSALEFAGSGNRIVYVDDARAYGLKTVPFAGGAPLTIDTVGSGPTITDDGRFVYYYGGIHSILRFDTVTTGKTPIWTTGYSGRPSVAGDGGRLLFATTPEYTLDLLATDGDGGAVEQIATLGEQDSPYDFDLSADGRFLAFKTPDLYVTDTDNGITTRLTQHAWIFNPAISDDGNTIAFVSAYELTPSTCSQVWAYRIAADGSELAELEVPVCPEVLDSPVVSGDASTIGLMADTQLYRFSGEGGVGSLILDDGAAVYKNPKIDGSGTWVVYTSSGNPTGENADGGFEVFRSRTDGTGLEQVTSAPDPAYASISPDVSADGTKIVYASYADALGTNTDHNEEIFLYDASTGVTEQLTDTSTGLNRVPRISPAGTYVAFGTSSDEYGPSNNVYRLTLADNTIELASAGIGGGGADWTRLLDVDVRGRVAFVSGGDLLGQNLDHSSEIWMAEFDVAPSFVIGSSSPTLLTWDPSPSFVSYDVVRGDLDALAAGAGETTDLGPVVCLENDSPDATTYGHEDLDAPEPGRGFFYLYRGNPSGSWGENSAAAARIAGSGACPD